MIMSVADVVSLYPYNIFCDLSGLYFGVFSLLIASRKTIIVSVSGRKKKHFYFSHCTVAV